MPMVFKLTLLAPLIAALLVCVPSDAADNVIHKQKSLYRNIVVKESANRRCLVFAVKKGDRNQTCMDLKNPKRVVFPYARMTFAGLLVNSAPESILVIGLGGGTIPTVLAELYPDTTIDVVEIDPAVIDVARTYFNYQENAGSTVYAQDARVYIKRAGLRHKQYDMVILDAFTGDYIPEHLMTMEFLQETDALLTPSGVLVANTFSTSLLYDHESVTYAAVFGEFINFKMPITGNRVVIASKQPLPSRREMFDRSKLLTARLENYGIHLAGFLPHLTTTKDWQTDVRPLTDQFSPANLLRGR
jgi:spermidine synthase